MLEKTDSKIQFHFDPKTLRGQVLQKASNVAWNLDLTAAAGVYAGVSEPMWMELPWAQHCRARDLVKPLAPEHLKEARELPAGVQLNFQAQGAEFSVCLTLGEEPGTLAFELRPSPRGAFDLVYADLPGPFRPAGASGTQVLVHQINQGKLFTGGLGELRPGRPTENLMRIHEGHQRMRFFGVLGGLETPGRAAAGYVAILEENADAELVLRREVNAGISCAPGWLPSMGTLAYPRKATFHFLDHPDITAMAKTYRRYAQTHGLFKPLREKLEERPLLKGILGATACFIGYLQGPHDYVGALRRLKQLGHRRFYIFPTFHLHNNLKPVAGAALNDIRNLHEEFHAQDGLVGSWAYLAGIMNGIKASRMGSRNPDGALPLNWQFGEEGVFQACPKQVWLDFLNREEEILASDVHHFDVTSSNALMECHAPAHMADRRQDREYRIKLFQECTRRGRVVASEGVKDWAVPHYDIGSNKEVAFPSASPAYRLVPLQHLAYHDALFFLWWEGNAYDDPNWPGGGDPLRQSLTDRLYGDMPLIFPVGRTYRWKDRAAWIPELYDQSLDNPLSRQAAELAVGVARQFERVATEEMTRFEFLTPDGAVQQTEFANGVSSIVNFGKEPFSAPGGKTVAPLDGLVL